MTENEIAARVMDASFRIHRELGPGLLESVYEIVLERDLIDSGLVVARQVAVPTGAGDLPWRRGSVPTWWSRTGSSLS